MYIMSDELVIVVYGLVLERVKNYCNLAFRKGLLLELFEEVLLSVRSLLLEQVQYVYEYTNDYYLVYGHFFFFSLHTC